MLELVVDVCHPVLQASPLSAMSSTYPRSSSGYSISPSALSTVGYVALLWCPTANDKLFVAGDILHFRVLGTSIVVLGSADVIFEYLDGRSANTSDRKQTPLIEL